MNEIRPAIELTALLERVEEAWRDGRQDVARLRALIAGEDERARRALEEAEKLVGADEHPPYDSLAKLREQLAGAARDSRELKADIERHEELLRRRAEREAVQPLWKKGLHILGSLCGVVPLPYVAIPGAVLAKLTADEGDEDYAARVQGVAASSALVYDDLASRFGGKTDGKKAGGGGAKERAESEGGKEEEGAGAEYASEIKKTTETAGRIVEWGEKLAGLVEATDGMFKPAPREKTLAILEKLKEDDGEYRVLTERVGRLMAEKTALREKLAELLDGFESRMTEAADAGARASALLDQLRAGAAGAPSLETRSLVADMRQGAAARLLGRQYSVARAYAHRVLRPYPVDFDVLRLAREIREALKAGGPGRDLGVEEAGKIAEVLRGEVMARVATSLTQAVETFGAEEDISFVVELSAEHNPELLERLNRERELRINLAETPWSGPFIDDQMIGGRITEITCDPDGVELTDVPPDNRNLQIRVYAPREATLVRAGKAHSFRYDASYYQDVAAVFSVSGKGVESLGAWGRSLDGDIFEELLRPADVARGVRLPALLKWPGADAPLRVRLNGDRRPRVARLAFKVYVRGFSDPDRDRRVRVRAAAERPGGDVAELPGVSVLSTRGGGGGPTPLTLIRGRRETVELRACPFVAGRMFSHWRHNGEDVPGPTALGGTYSFEVRGNHAIEAVYR